MLTVRDATILLVGATAGSGVGVMIGGTKSDTTIAVPAEAKDITDPALAQKLVDAQTDLPVTCELGVISNHPNEVYCSDGARAGFLADVDEGKYQLLNGKLYSVP